MVRFWGHFEGAASRICQQVGCGLCKKEDAKLFDLSTWKAGVTIDPPALLAVFLEEPTEISGKVPWGSEVLPSTFCYCCGCGCHCFVV